MSTQLLAIFCVLFLALGVLFLAVFTMAACVQSGRDAEAERAASANWDYPADGPDTSNGSEIDHAD